MIKVEYIDHMGSDLTVVNAARVSFDKHHKEFLDNDIKLIQYLAAHKHENPTFHPQITLRETVPIFIARQRFKHTVGFTYNEVSRRYVDSEPEFFIPEYWRQRAPNKKQGSIDKAIENNKSIQQRYEAFLNQSLSLYKGMLDIGVAPEQARMILPQSMMTSYYVTGSLGAFIRAFNLRSSPDAQQEIFELAGHWKYIIEPLFPVTWEAFTTH